MKKAVKLKADVAAEHRDYDMIVIGATGFTGRRTARELINKYSSTYRIGLAARDKKRLEALATKLGLSTKDCFTLDTTDTQVVKEVVGRSRLIISTVGPYALYGESVIAACAQLGTHYTDITGEVDFIARMTECYAEEARASGARLVSFCGFDSVPAEVAVHKLTKRFGAEEELTIQSYYTTKGGLNGGTIATMLNKLASGGDNESVGPDVLIAAGKYAESAKKVKDKNNTPKPITLIQPKDARFFGFVGRIQRWSTPFVMSGINARVVYRSVSDMQQAGNYSLKCFGYSEQSSLGRWYTPISFITTSILLLCLASFGPLAWFRRILSHIVPAPGQGPSERSIEQGFMRLHVFAKGSSGQREELQCFFSGDPSNKATVFFLVQSSILLLKKLKAKSLAPAGFHTPYTAFGEALEHQLTNQGYEITI
tara:strand:- start:8439 stop:9716 length:1278 start_codon:yes stop_codon:yes gene_type:complete